MPSKTRPTLNGSFRDELLLPTAVQSHQLEAIRDPGVPTRALAAEQSAVVPPPRLGGRAPTASKRLNDALRPAAANEHRPEQRWRRQAAQPQA